MNLVIVESPYAGKVDENEQYARRCIKDCLDRGEAPFASHLLYTQPGVLDDKVPEQRKLGIEAGLSWGVMASATVVYTDLGISEGMSKGITRAVNEGREVIYRKIGVGAKQRNEDIYGVMVHGFKLTNESDDDDYCHADDPNLKGWKVFVVVQTPEDPKQTFDTKFDRKFDTRSLAIHEANLLADLLHNNPDEYEEY